MGHPVLDPKSIPVPLQRLMVPDGMLATLANGAVRWDDGSESIAAISGAGTPQQLYAQAVEVPFAMVWVSPGVRLRALPRSTREELQDRAHRIGLELVTLPIARALADGLHAAAEPSEALRRRHAAASALALEYAHTGDLSTLVELAQASGNTVALGWSPDLRVGYVLVEVREKATVIRVAALLGATPGPPCVRIEPGPNLDAEVWRAIGAWCPRLEISGLAQPP